MLEDKPWTSRFDNFGAKPSDELWNKIEAQLDKKKKRGLVFWWFTGLAGTALLVFGSLHFFSKELETSSVVKKNNHPPAAKHSISKRSNAGNAFTQQTFAPNPVSLKKSRAESVFTAWNTTQGEDFLEKEMFQRVKESKKHRTDKNTVALSADNSNQIANPVQDKDTVVEESSSDTKMEMVTETPVLKVPTTKGKGFEFAISLGAARSEKVYAAKDQPYISIGSSVPDNNSLNFESGDSSINHILPFVPIQLQILVGKNLGRFVRVSSGLGLQLYSERTHYTAASVEASTKSLIFAQLPFLVDLKILSNEKWEWSAGSGVTLAYHRIGNTPEWIGHWNMNWHLQTAVRFQFSPRWQAFLQPNYRLYTSKNALENSPYRNKFIGLNLGLVRTF